MGLKLALQVYSVREDAEKDFAGTLGRIKEMGYEGVEFAGLYGMDPIKLRAILDAAGLAAVSAHVPIDAFLSDMKGTIETYKSLGCKYVAMPWLEEARRPGQSGYAATVEDIRRIGEACSEAGIELMYHNHDFEFTRIEDGRYALDALYESIPASILKAQIDTCWVNVAGEDPVDYVLKYAGREPTVHLKDFIMKGRGKPHNMYALIDGAGHDDKQAQSADFDFRPVGYGVQDMPAIIEAARKSGAQWVIVEQDRSSDMPPMKAAQLSAEYVRGLL